MSELRWKIFGKRHGNFSLRQLPMEEVFKRIEKLLDEHLSHLSEIYSLKTGFTANFVDLEKSLHEKYSPRFLRTPGYVDGGIITAKNSAIGILNGDCPVLCLTENDKLAVLHAGYRCLIGANPKEENIIESAMRQFNPNRVRAFIFGGIGPCCWVPEYDDKPEILNPDLSRHSFILESCLNKTSSASPFGPGHVSVNLYKLSCELLKDSGVPASRIRWHHECSCCAEENGELVYWSHTRHVANGQSVDGRNLALAWLE